MKKSRTWSVLQAGATRARCMAIDYLCFAVYSKFEPTFDGLESDQSKPSYLMNESHSNDFFASLILPNLG